MRVAAGALLACVCVALVLSGACDQQPESPARMDPQDNLTQVGTLPYSDKGTQDVTGVTVQRLDAENFSFSPTFLHGSPGQTIALAVENTTDDTSHNITVIQLGVDRDIPPSQAVEVDIIFPASGALQFMCKLHTTRGMNGQLLVGDATPVAQP